MNECGLECIRRLESGYAMSALWLCDTFVRNRMVCKKMDGTDLMKCDVQ